MKKGFGKWLKMFFFLFLNMLDSELSAKQDPDTQKNKTRYRVGHRTSKLQKESL